MSAEKIISTEVNDLPPLATPKKSEEASSGRVDINHLIARVRKEQQKESKLNFIYFSVFASLFIFIGVILTF
jgi:hypothetical protein|tara:strand:- start:95 stop:310 length:216 start_codon:yes stop_codon:yes gene_type:complete